MISTAIFIGVAIRIAFILRAAGSGVDDYYWQQVAKGFRQSRKLPLVLPGKYLMEEFYNAGGIKALLWQIREHLHLDAMTVTGQTLGDNIRDTEVIDDDIMSSQCNISCHPNAIYPSYLLYF